MADRMNPGIGGNTPQERRVQAIERFLGRFSVIRITAADEFGKPQIFTAMVERGAPVSTSSAGAFFAVYKDTKKGGWCLQGGQVTAGNKSEVLDHIWLVKTGSEPKDGHKHWLTITGDGSVVAGRLQGVFNLTKVTDGHGETMPVLTLPTKANPKGRSFHLYLGSWRKKEFIPAQLGNVNITFCPNGGYTEHRGA